MSRPPEPIELHPFRDARPLACPAGFAVVSTAISSHNDLLRLLAPQNSATEAFGRVEQPGWASFPKTGTDEEYAAILSIHDTHAEREVPLKGLNATFPRIQLFPNQDILVVAPRCRRFKDGTCELNAKVYSPDSDLKRSFVLGDGIEDIQIDRQGRIWVSYFDEGIFGNFGWGGSAVPYGASGLTCFDGAGKRLWDFESPSGFDTICDCYALNTSKDKVWVYYYAQFPIVQIDAQLAVRGWKTDFRGARALAVHGTRVLLFGGYDDQRAACRLVELRNDAAAELVDVRLVFPEGFDLSTASFFGRDNELHVVSSDVWCVFSMLSLA